MACGETSIHIVYFDTGTDMNIVRAHSTIIIILCVCVCVWRVAVRDFKKNILRNSGAPLINMNRKQQDSVCLKGECWLTEDGFWYT